MLGDSQRVSLFGSQLHDPQNGGDIDLCVAMPHPDLMQNLCCKVQLQDRLDMPVDLVLKPVSATSPISLLARQEGIVL